MPQAAVATTLPECEVKLKLDGALDELETVGYRWGDMPALFDIANLT
jgi:hypothetical protein